ncbi:MAG: benzoate-CoA ligase family protein [Xanthobacteraceae bacterium]|nr:benzoate-CoA ligase family protein [Xanthobacteraceae bacterium]
MPDRVPWRSPGAVEINFRIPARYNASEVLFQNCTRGHADRAAVTGPAGRRRYGQLCADAGRWGNALLSLGLGRGDRVLLLLDDTPVYPAVFFGAVRAGLVPLLINVLTPPDLLQFYLSDSAATVAVAEADFADRFNSTTCAGTQLKSLIVMNGKTATNGGLRVIDAAAWLPAFGERLASADTQRDDMAFWMYSSGSTGRPKGIVHLQHDMPYTHASYGRHVLKLAADDVCFSVPKIFFSYGFGNSITFPFSVGACSLLLPGRPKPAAIFDAIARYRPTVFFGLPTLYTMLTKAPEAGTADLSSIRMAVSAAEVLSAEVFRAWQALSGQDIVECLGATELLSVYLSNRPGRQKLGSAGLRVPGYELVVMDEHGQQEVEDGREGTLWVRGHSATPGYWNRPQETAKTVRDGGWICSGDRFIRDADGFYFFRGRSDDLVKIAGQWIHPIEVQLCLAEHPAVRECAVLAVELPDRRVTLKAFVVMNARAFDRPRTTRLLQDYVKRTLMPHQYPRIVQFLPELPKTGTGKIDRQALCGMDTGTCDAKTWDASTCDTNTWDAKIRTSVRTDSRQGDAAAAKKARSNRHETERGIETARAAAGRR